LARIELRQLAKSYADGIEALKPTDLSIDAGELVVVLGPSGSGKSTLLRLIAGLETPSGGSVWIEGRDVTAVPPHRRDAAMVFQHPAIYPHLSVFENLASGLKARGAPRDQVRAKVNTTAGLLGLDRLLARRPDALSGGERQRVAIGRAIIRQPSLVLFDEPFASLDLPLKAGLRDQVMDLHRRFRTTLIHVTHDQAEALLMGDRILVLDRGQILQCGTPRAIYDRPAHRFVATFVGSPPMNILPCQIKRERETIQILPLASDVAFPWTQAPTALPPGWEGTTRLFDLGLRPEAILVQKPGDFPGSQPAEPRLTVKVRRVEYNGPELLATLDLGPHRLVARLPSSQAMEERQPVDIMPDLSRAVWFDQSTGEAVREG
jgi:multiple sugar transport system ATP-binding protein